jgi:putative polyketide hydroxylase
MNSENIPVLIVGSGGAGLSLSLLLLQQGIQPMLVERRAEVSWYPRARNLNFRTMEIFRGLGLIDEIRAAGSRVSRIFARQHIASSEEKQVMDPATLLDTKAFSPEPFLWYCPQSRFEPILLAAARERGADVHYGTELVELLQDDTGVTATLKDGSTLESRTVRAQFLVGADGAHSTVREALKIPTKGKGALDEHWVFIYFRAAWEEFVRGHETDVFLIENPDVRGMFLIAEKNLGMFILQQKETGEELSRERSHELMQKAIGRSDIAVEILEVTPWQPEQRVADQFQQGRVFLLGDAAHTMPPKEGLGVNTAIQSAQNLGWKLAAVLAGQASPELLSTYQSERHPVAWFATKHSMTGPAAALLEKNPKEKKSSEFFPIVGYRYRSSAILPEDGQQQNPDEITLLDREDLTGVPGTRVPHLWLNRGEQRISTLDLLDGGFVLITGTNGTSWSQATEHLANSLGIQLTLHRIGEGGDVLDPENQWSEKMGVTPDGAVLVRPDGFVAWRTRGVVATPEQLLKQVLNRVLSRPASPAIAELHGDKVA